MENRIVLCHTPFPYTPEPPFDIEIETYTEWCRLLRQHVKPQLMLCGHVHKCYVTPVGGDLDHKGQPCPVVVASEVRKDGAFLGGAIELYPDNGDIKFTDQMGNVKDSLTIAF